jgi:glucose/arabinose dehydrogenase
VTSIVRLRPVIAPLLSIQLLLVLLAPTSAFTGPSSEGARALSNFGLQPLAVDLDRPVQVVDPGDGSGRLFFVEQGGLVLMLRDGQVEAQPFLDLTGVVSCCGERGLLSLVFHPDFATNGYFFVDYTDSAGDTVVARYRVSAAHPDLADPSSAETIVWVDQPASNHNGGLILFGPRDGYLYVGLGDGGGGNGQNSQDPATLLGKLLRIDVNNRSEGLRYAIPPDNPFVDVPGARPEIWVSGLRNPWRFSFDRETGDLWIGDVGSATYEEVNYQPADSPGGENYGWNLMEGTDCRDDAGCEGFVPPVSGFDRDEGCVVTGGYVYRGQAVPSLAGIYLFADYCGGSVWGLARDPAGGWARSGPVETGLRISSFGEDAAGELYLVDLDGAVYRLVALAGES